MAQFKVRVCSEVWNYYEFTIEAADEDEAAGRCEAMIDDDKFEWPEPDDVDGAGWEIHRVDELPPR